MDKAVQFIIKINVSQSILITWRMCGYFREKLHVNHFKVKALGLTMMGSHEITLLIGRTLCFALHQQWS